MGRADSGFAKGWARLGASLHALKHFREALNAYQRAKALDPGNISYDDSMAELQKLVQDGRGVATASEREAFYYRRSVDQATAASKAGNHEDACRLSRKRFRK